MTPDSLRSACLDLRERLLGLDMDLLDASDYFKGYLASYVQDLDSILPRYRDILISGMGDRAATDTNLLDFGGGVGMLALLAKTAGLAFVCHMDISDEMTRGARNLSALLKVPIDEFITCSYEDIERSCAHRFDVIANYDVLEHLYDPEKAFIELREVLRDPGTILMASGANTFNPIINLLFRRKHLASEHTGTISGKEMDSREPFFAIRQRIIQAHAPHLTRSVVLRLAALTRGLRQEDIIRSVDRYVEGGILPEPLDSTNTCDPITGNWDERLIGFHAFSTRLGKSFPEVHVRPGYYPETPARFIPAPDVKDSGLLKTLYPFLSYLSKLLAPWLNGLIRALPHVLKFVVAPYYMVIARSHGQGVAASAVAGIYNAWAPWQGSPAPLRTDTAYVPALSGRYLLETLKRHTGAGPLKIADLGCGNGSMALRLEAEGYHVAGTDIAGIARGVLKDFHLCSVTDLPFGDNEVDMAYSFSVLHHVDDLDDALREVRRVLKAGSLFMATFHTRRSPYFLEMAVKKRIFPERYRHYDHLFIRPVDELCHAFTRNGFEIVRIDGIHVFYPLHFLMEGFEYLKARTGLKIGNPFARLDEDLKRFVPDAIRAEMAYHSLFLVRKS